MTPLGKSMLIVVISIWLVVMFMAGMMTQKALGDEVASRSPYDAIRLVESGGADNAVGDLGTSRGGFQIGMAYWRDGCEAGGVQWDYLSLVWSRPHCEYIMHSYWKRYGAKTDEEKARCHNSGPKWRTKYHLTNEYWNRVKEIMR